VDAGFKPTSGAPFRFAAPPAGSYTRPLNYGILSGVCYGIYYGVEESCAGVRKKLKML